MRNEGGIRKAQGRRGASIALALATFAALSALTGLIFRGAAELARLESRNEAERVLNALLGGLRDHPDFGAAVEASPSLREKITGIGIFGREGERLYAWGEVPAAYSRPDPSREGLVRFERSYIERGRENSLVLVLRSSRLWPPPPPEGLDRPAPPEDRDGLSGELRAGFFDTLRKSEFVYLALRQGGYFRSERLRALLFPLVELCLALLVFGARRLLLRNLEYRERIEEQKSLVVLGTAASTLAHEIKNPLLAIRLQTSLIARGLPGGRKSPELEIIEAEVERLSQLSHRVGDYLREPRGSPRRIDPAEIAAEVGRRLLGRELLAPKPEGGAEVLFDPERLRSIFENLLRNALEAGGAEEGISIELSRGEGRLRVDILDRGRGLGPEEAERAFDPFYTTKSRGSGIGLPISRRFAQAMGGSLALFPREGGGSRARLDLPLAAPEPPAGGSEGAGR